MFFAACSIGLSKILFRTEGFKGIAKGVFIQLILVLMMLLCYMVCISPVVLLHDITYGNELSEIFLKGIGVDSLFAGEGVRPGTFIYRVWESRIIYSYHGLSLLVAGIGLLLVVVTVLRRRTPRQALRQAILLFMGGFCYILYLAGFIAIRTELDSASYTFFWFLAIGISLLAAYFFDLLYINRVPRSILLSVLSLVCMLFFLGFAFSGFYTPRITNRGPGQDIVLGMDVRAQTRDMYEAAHWLSEHASSQSRMVGDITVHEIFSGMFDFEVSTDEYRLQRLYNGTREEFDFYVTDERYVFGSYAHTRYVDGVHYIIVNSAFFEGSTYLFGKPLAAERLNRFEESGDLTQVYANNRIMIYKVIR
jgi:hypothetical protein